MTLAVACAMYGYYYGGHDSASHMLHYDHSVFAYLSFLELGVPEIDRSSFDGSSFLWYHLSLLGIMVLYGARLPIFKGKKRMVLCAGFCHRYPLSVLIGFSC